MIDFLDNLFKTAHIHVMRLTASMEMLRNKIPLSANDVDKFTLEDLLVWEMFTNRFSKLQDLVGAKIFKSVLDYAGESTDSMTLIDRLHTLQKFGILLSDQAWRDLREMRNHLAHEYPGSPELTAGYLNRAFELAPILLETVEKLEAFVKELRLKNGDV